MDKNTRLIDVLIFDDMNILDMAGPVQAFYKAHRNGHAAYAVRSVSVDGRSVRTTCGIGVESAASLDEASEALDLLIPGGAGTTGIQAHPKVMETVASWLDQHPDGRLITICSGALVAAHAGALDGREATTHWSCELEALSNYPRVDWQTDRIFVKDGRTYSSAGVTTGIDLALSIIRADCGATQALTVARELVVSLRRVGGQSQFSDVLDAQFALEEPVAQLVDAVNAAPADSWTLETMANHVGMTPRTLARRFDAALRTSPVKFVERVRTTHARNFLSDGMAPAMAARRSGFADMQQMRRAFERQVGVSVRDYRARFAVES